VRFATLISLDVLDLDSKVIILQLVHGLNLREVHRPIARLMHHIKVVYHHPYFYLIAYLKYFVAVSATFEKIWYVRGLLAT
jgi:hypothetical protein